MCKKFVSYSIFVVYLNGKEEINYTKENLDVSNYKEMLEVYRETKLQLADTCATIQFCGKTSNNEKLEIMFEKEIVTEDKFVKEEGERVAELTGYQALQNLNKAIEDIEKVRQRADKNIELFLKSQDIMLHNIENSNSKEVSMLEKIEMYDALKTLRGERREYKESYTVIENFKKNLKKGNVNYDAIQCHINKAIQHQDKYIANNKHENLTNEQNKIIKDKMSQKVKYRSYKERDITILRLKKIYDRVEDNLETMSLFCYNFACK